MKAIFLELCPNCHGEISDERLSIGAPCEKCLDIPFVELLDLYQSLNRKEYVKKIYELLKSKKTLKYYEKIYKIVEKEEKFEEIYSKALDSTMWNPQRSWLRRYYLGYSFAIVAPTGLGKTTFLLLLALEEASQGKKIYFIFPTSVLLYQAYNKILEFKEKLNLNVNILAYHKFLNTKEKKEVLEKIINKDFDILMTTSQFLVRNFDKLSGFVFDLICVDDVDALLKSSKNIDRVLKLLGFNEKIISMGLEYLKIVSRKQFDEKTQKRIEEIQKEISEYKSSNKIGKMIVASATGRQKGLKSRLFRVLLGFEAGATKGELRNIIDSYILSEDYMKAIKRVVNDFKDGGLIFIKQGEDEKVFEAVKNLIEELGFKAEIIRSKTRNLEKIIESFRNCEIDILISVASFYGTIVRGLDLPERIKYVIFYGVPRFTIRSDLEEISPTKLLIICNTLLGKLPKDIENKILAKIKFLKQYLTPEILNLIKLHEEEGKELEGFAKRVYDEYLNLKQLTKELLENSEIIEKIKEDPYINFKEIEEGKYIIEIPDINTYIQASGRCSRMYAGGITKGLSVVVEKEEKLIKSLEKLLSLKYEESKFVDYNQLDINELRKEIEEDRKKVKLVLEGKLEEVRIPEIKSTLFVVESPNKARTIAHFFGRPSRIKIGNINVYEVSIGNRILLISSSIGHIYDLVTKRGIFGIEFINNKYIPVYTTIKMDKETGETYTDQDIIEERKDKISDKIEIIRSLQEVAMMVDEVIIGTDFDTEGEKIAWDIFLTLQPYTDSIKRATFTEVTRTAIMKALDNLREIDIRWVEAQIVRRIEDRWIGFSLSRKLWEQFNMHWLSAGRVQTPVLGWVIKRYEEYKKEQGYFFNIVTEDGVTLTTTFKVKTLQEVKQVMDLFLNNKLRIKKIELTEKEVFPPKPYTTDTLLQEATRALRLSADKVMNLAQDLFELGLCTYHRTDSTTVSTVGLAIAKEYISQKYSEEYFVPRRYETHGAHECIRPTRPLDVETLRRMINEGVITLQRPLTKYHFKLYDLIFRRFIASQMKPAKVIYAKVEIELPNGAVETIEGTMEIKEYGYLQEYGSLKTIPMFKEGDEKIIKFVRYWKGSSVQLYTQSDIIALMKEREIGRPSTYAKIVSTLLKRRYVIESQKVKYLIPSRLGISVYKYLDSNFKDIVSEERTRELEAKMDLIERGEIYYQDVLKETYEELKTVIEEVS